MKLYFLLVISFVFIGTVNGCCCGCCCDCCCCCCNQYAHIPTTTAAATTTDSDDNNNNNNNNGNGNGNTARGIKKNRILNSNGISMDDYLKVQEIIEGSNKIRARRYSYDLSEKLAADSSHYRHGDREELLEDDADLDLLTPKTTTHKPTISIIRAINPQKLDGAPYIPAPRRHLNDKGGEEHAEEVPDLGVLRS